MPIILLVKSDGTVEPLRSAGAGQALVMDPKVGSLVSYEGTTTADGAPGGTTLVCSDLTTKPDYDGNLVIITSGDYQGQARDINGATNGGTVTPDIAFGGQIVSGVTFVIVGIRTVPAEVAALMADVGDASTSTLGSLYAILGNPAQSFLAMIGYQGATSLANKLTAARAALLDQITAGRMAELDAANIPTDLAVIIAFVDELETRLSAVRAGYLDELGPTNIPADTDPKVMGRLQIKATTIDLNQVAGTYDLFTGTTQDVVVERLVIRMSGGAAGGALTSISIQTDDATPIILIDAVAGAVANLTNEAQLAWTGAALLDAGTSAKIRLTIAGGATGFACVCDVIAECRAVVSSGYLA